MPLVTGDGQPVRYPLRAFVQTWGGELTNWWTHYDADTLAAELTDEQFENFLTTTDGTVRFADASVPHAKTRWSGHDSARSDRWHGCRMCTCSA